MKNVRIEYTRYHFFHRQVEINVPERWEDLNCNQFATCAGIYIKPLGDVEFISRYFGIKKNLVKRMSKFEQYRLTELAGFATKPTGTVNFFYMEEIPGTKLLSPAGKLRDVSFEHFSLFDTFFFDYANEPTEDNLCRLVAAIYLKKNEKVTEIDFERRVRHIAFQVDKATQYAIFLNYVFLRDWLSKTFRFIFEKSDSEDEKLSQSKRNFGKVAKPGRPDWNSILDSLVGDDILNYDSYKAMSCILAFKTINKRLKEFKRNGK